MIKIILRNLLTVLVVTVFIAFLFVGFLLFIEEIQLVDIIPFTLITIMYTSLLVFRFGFVSSIIGECFAYFAQNEHHRMAIKLLIYCLSLSLFLSLEESNLFFNILGTIGAIAYILFDEFWRKRSSMAASLD